MSLYNNETFLFMKPKILGSKKLKKEFFCISKTSRHVLGLVLFRHVGFSCIQSPQVRKRHLNIVRSPDRLSEKT